MALGKAPAKSSALLAAEKQKAGSKSIVEGSKAPRFEVQDASGHAVSSEVFAGKPYVLYFYPKDDTPGCTTEACGFRDSLSRFTKQRVKILGVSPDSAASHSKFRDKYGLNFTLLVDADKQLAKAYGVWVKKQNYGREYLGIERSTFLIGADGTVKKCWRRVRVPGHVDAVLAEAQKLA